MKTIMTVIGTRPEAIKLAPIIKRLIGNKYFQNKVCVTGQHASVLDSLLLNMNIQSDYKFEFNINKKTLNDIAAHLLSQFSNILKELKLDLIIVQGDTTSAFVSALAGFYSQIPIAHIEAGLRTGNINSPWPEEAHRCFIDKISTYFFSPSVLARFNLLNEGIRPDKIWVIGNTSIDAMRFIKESQQLNKNLDSNYIIVTVHRKENQGAELTRICKALIIVAKQFPHIQIKFCLHPNPTIADSIKKLLYNIDNIALIEPVDHISFLQLLNNSLFVITDSGGVQEEVTFIGKPVIIVRESTERPEVVAAGTGILVGTNTECIIKNCIKLLEDPYLLKAMSKIHFPYGKGYAAHKIVNILEQEYKKGNL